MDELAPSCGESRNDEAGPLPGCLPQKACDPTVNMQSAGTMPFSNGTDPVNSLGGVQKAEEAGLAGTPQPNVSDMGVLGATRREAFFGDDAQSHPTIPAANGIGPDIERQTHVEIGDASALPQDEQGKIHSVDEFGIHRSSADLAGTPQSNVSNMKVLGTRREAFFGDDAEAQSTIPAAERYTANKGSLSLRRPKIPNPRLDNLSIDVTLGIDDHKEATLDAGRTCCSRRSARVHVEELLKGLPLCTVLNFNRLVMRLQARVRGAICRKNRRLKRNFGKTGTRLPLVCRCMPSCRGSSEQHG